MATIVTRAGKGSPLTHDEVDDNFDNLNTDKVETSAIGTAAAANTGDFATAAQGVLADGAVQPNDSPTFGGLTVDGTDTEVLITEDSEGSATLRFADTQADPAQSYAIAYDTSSNKANFKINNTQRANFNSSGDYMVGPATTDNPFVIYNANNDATKAGVGLRQTGYIAAARMNDHTMMLNRMGTDGLTMGIRNDGTFVGGLGNVGGELTFHDSTSAEAMRLDSSGRLGIGTITPSTALDVTGTVTATAFSGGEVVGSISTGTLDLSTGNVFSDAPSANATYVFSNPPASGTAYGFTLKITPSATVTVTWPTSVDWAAGTAPDAPASGTTSVFVFYTQDGGTTYYGFLAGEAMA